MQHPERPVWRSRSWAIAIVAVMAVVLGMSFLGVADPTRAWVALAAIACLIGAVLVGTLLRVRHERRAHEERLTAWAAERAVQEERLRIARDLHDLASHGLGLITVRAAAAGRGGDPEEHAAALADIERAARGATTELRRMLAVLRPPGLPGSEAHGESAPLRPAETLADLPRILDAARTAGLRVELESSDRERLARLSPGMQLTVCAIVREALTNAARHAGPTGVRVSLRERPEPSGGVALTIRDDGPAQGWIPSPGTGAGLAGLRERVAALGGTLSAGSDLGSTGYALIAELPDRLPEGAGAGAGAERTA